MRLRHRSARALRARRKIGENGQNVSKFSRSVAPKSQESQSTFRDDQPPHFFKTRQFCSDAGTLGGEYPKTLFRHYALGGFVRLSPDLRITREE